MGRMVWVAAAAAFVLRFPSLLWPLRPDEAGFLLVARSWHAEPDSLYGHYWVDRPPPIIWLVQATDALVGPYAHRLLGAVACTLLVLAAAASAREVAHRAGVLDEPSVRRLAGWVAVATAALVGNVQIDPVAANGELFGIPLVLGSCWLALRAVRRVSAGDAFGAGLLAHARGRHEAEHRGRAGLRRRAARRVGPRRLDLVGVALSGSFWTPYLFVPIPGLALALAVLLGHDHLDQVRHRVTPAVVAVVVVSSAIALAGWTGAWVEGRVPVEVRTGQAIADVARPGDRVLVYGGRADIQWASRASSPYPYLWSLPMRTLDPGLTELESVLTGSNPPTWFVEATYINTWSELGTRPVESHLIRKYEFIRTACDRYRIYHLNTVEPVDVDIDCTTPYRTIWGTSRRPRATDRRCHHVQTGMEQNSA